MNGRLGQGEEEALQKSEQKHLGLQVNPIMAILVGALSPEEAVANFEYEAKLMGGIRL